MKLKEFDASHWQDLRTLYLQVRRDSFHWQPTAHFQQEDFDRDSEGERIFVVEDSGSPAGFISIWEPDQFIHHLYVASAYQNHGIGSMLIEHAKAEYGELSLKCMVKNQKAVDFYRRKGFQVVSQIDDAFGGHYLMRIR